MLPELVRRPMLGNNEGTFGDELDKEISLLLREQRRQEADDLEKELNLYRSGSAPPIVDGSLSAVGGLFNHGSAIGNGSPAFAEFSRSKNGNGFMSEEELRSDPAYLSYYYSNVNLNPRLPPPVLSKEDWRFTQKLHEGSSTIGDRRKVNKTDNGGGGRSMFSMPPGFNSRKQDNVSDSDNVQLSTEWGGDGLIGLSGLEIGRKQTILAEIFQDDLSHATSASEYLSRPSSCNGFGENANSLSLTEVDRAQLHCDFTSVDPVLSAAGFKGSPVVQNMGPPAAYSFAAALGASLSRSVTPDAQRTARAPSPCLTPIGEGRINNSEKRNTNSASSFSAVSDKVNESTDLVAALSGISLSNGIINEENHLQSQVKQDVNDHNSYLLNISGGETNANQHLFLKGSESGQLHFPNVHRAAKVDMASVDRTDHRNSFFQGEMHRASLSNKSSLKGFSNSTLSGGGLLSHHQHVDSANSSLLNYGVSGCPMTPMSNHLSNYNLPHLFENGAAGSAMTSPDIDSRIFRGSNLSSFVPGENFNRLGNQIPGSLLQPSVMDPMYLQYLRTAEYAAALNDSSVDRNYLGNSYMELIQKPYHGSLLSPQNSQYCVPMSGNSSGSTHHGYYGNPAFGVGLSYPGSPLASSVTPNSPAGPGSPMRQGEFNMRFPSGMRNLAGVIGPWHLDNMDNGYGSSLLEEFKNNKTKCFELSEIAGHVVEFSADQYGSRFIQQKLETATMEEKHMVFEEIIPQALTLMTDVFGNYVVQKFFEHGMASQRRELASKLFGHVLTLSLQMYGCRVIQKAIEVVDLDQKIKMVEELDGHVMRCVRDQNGNHVIQKCIECVPEDHIQFIVSTFFDQVVTLSTHPYGCRVIQRVLEHCKDSKTQSKVMDEILGTVSSLAQDQYGNYVVQHVLQHGKPHERSAIIQELAGNIVQMSLQKFASNVVEKCLTFGDPTERQLLVNEMLGSTDENEPLQAMMKDQFANYVVQKVLETCNDQQRELILSRIKVHLTALKKYTYGKHIVVRVEKLVATGERRIAAQSPNPA